MEAGRPATWTGEWWKSAAGGTVWDSISYDPKLNLVYIGVGNGSPWAQKFAAPTGRQPVPRLDRRARLPETGDYRLALPDRPGEEWDYTATQQ
jgi:glucose dehydrogenase